MGGIGSARILWGEASLLTCHSEARGNQISFQSNHQERRLSDILKEQVWPACTHVTMVPS